MYLGDESLGMQDMLEAQRSKAVPEHDVIDDAIRDKGEEYTVFSIVSILFSKSQPSHSGESSIMIIIVVFLIRDLARRHSLPSF